MSVNELTLATAWIAGLAIVALVATGWRKPARATPRRLVAGDRPNRRPPLEVEHVPTVAYHAPGPLRRLMSTTLGLVLMLVTGAVLATVTGFGFAFTVVHLSNLLKK